MPLLTLGPSCPLQTILLSDLVECDGPLQIVMAFWRTFFKIWCAPNSNYFSPAGCHTRPRKSNFEKSAPHCYYYAARPDGLHQLTQSGAGLLLKVCIQNTVMRYVTFIPIVYPEPEFANILKSPGIDSLPDGIDSLALIHGFLKRLQIRLCYINCLCPLLPGITLFFDG